MTSTILIPGQIIVVCWIVVVIVSLESYLFIKLT